MKAIAAIGLILITIAACAAILFVRALEPTSIGAYLFFSIWLAIPYAGMAVALVLLRRSGFASLHWYTAMAVVAFIVPALYIVGAIIIWLEFLGSPPDGLANIWIAIYTFPIVIIGTFLLHGEFPYVPGRYYEAQTLYFWPSVALLALALFLIFHALQKSSIPPLQWTRKKPRATELIR